MYWLLLIPHFIVAIVAMIIAPILPMFAIGKDELPSWLSWFQTPDASIDGDSAFQDKQKNPFIQSLPGYIRRVFWLWRNPSYGFDWSIMATKPLAEGASILGDHNCSRELGKTTWVYVKCGKYWQYKIYVKYPLLKHCFGINLGWNIHVDCVANNYIGKIYKYRFTPCIFSACPG